MRSKLKITTLHINAQIGITILGILALILVLKGHNCEAQGIAALIAPIAMYFAKSPENGTKKGEEDE